MTKKKRDGIIAAIFAALAAIAAIYGYSIDDEKLTGVTIELIDTIEEAE